MSELEPVMGHVPGCNFLCRGDDHYLLSNEESQIWHEPEAESEVDDE